MLLISETSQGNEDSYAILLTGPQNLNIHTGSRQLDNIYEKHTCPMADPRIRGVDRKYTEILNNLIERYSLIKTAKRDSNKEFIKYY